MEQTNTSNSKVLLSEKDRNSLGLSRSMWYALLNRSDMPIVVIGGRKFMHRELFLKWLEEQATAFKEGA